MTSIILAAVLLTSVESTHDGKRFILNFDAPVAFNKTSTASPPGIVIDVPEAASAPGLVEAELPAGLSLEPMLDAEGLRVTLALPGGASGRVSTSGSSITVDLEADPLHRVSEPVTPRRSPDAPIPDAAIPMTEGSRADPSGDTVIGPEDLLELNVFELPELKTTVRVMGDGTVSLPLLGLVQAAGLTTTGLEARIRELLEARFVLDPQVTITVTEHRSRQVSIIGAVSKPGPYEMIGPRSVLQMISEAGGLTKEAGTDIFIIRKTESGQARRIGLDLEELITKGNPELNVTLAPGDVINVPVDKPIYVYVDGAVSRPGEIEGKASRPVTLLQAVARSGGLTERANLKGVHILRKTDDGGQTRIPVNLRSIRKGKSEDIILVDGDVIVVPETFF